MEHWLEHALIAPGIGLGACLITVLVHYILPHPAYIYATVAWIGGVFYYLGREVRDAEKGTTADGFDYSGLGAPIVSCALVFGAAAFVASRRYEPKATALFSRLL